MTTKETTTADEAWLTPADVARRLRVSVKTVRRELDRSHLIGQTRRTPFPHSQGIISAWAAELRAKNAASF